MNSSKEFSNSHKSTKILLSIKPEYASAIFSGEKQYEYRKVKFSKEVNTVVVYVTSPVSKVVAEFEVEEIIGKPPKELWEKTWKHAGIDEQFFFDYFLDRDIGYALKIGEIHHYDSPFDPIKELGIRPPQSFVYLSS